MVREGGDMLNGINSLQEFLAYIKSIKAGRGTTGSEKGVFPSIGMEMTKDISKAFDVD